jgi:CheY-like chemotaxis protein
LSRPPPSEYLELSGRNGPGRIDPSGAPGCHVAPLPDVPRGSAAAKPVTATGLTMSEKGPGQSMSLAGISILLAEDNPTNQMVATQMLESLGADVTLAVDGAEALDILADRSFDVALIDIEMPRVSGIDLIRRVRASPGPIANMPMVALTAYVMREQRAAIEHAGADGIIAKPILSIEKFGDDILAFMRQRRERVAPDGPAEQGATTTVAAGIDRAIFGKLWESFDPAGRAELKTRIMQDIRGAVDIVGQALRDREQKRLRSATHVLIAVAGVIGAQKLQLLARRLNSAGHGGDDSGLDGDGAELIQEAERVLDFVSRR